MAHDSHAAGWAYWLRPVPAHRVTYVLLKGTPARLRLCRASRTVPVCYGCPCGGVIVVDLLELALVAWVGRGNAALWRAAAASTAERARGAEPAASGGGRLNGNVGGRFKSFV